LRHSPVSELEQLRAERDSYREQANRYRRLAEQSTDMISRHSPYPEWVYIDVNPAVEKLLGYSVAEMIGTRGYDLFHPDDAENLKQRAETVSYRHGVYTNVYRYRHKMGHYVFLETTSRTIRDAKGNTEEIICVSRDVTERELALQATRRLARVVEASTDLIMFCNHDDKRLTYLNESAFRTLSKVPENPHDSRNLKHLEQLFDPQVYQSLVPDALAHAAEHGIWYGSIPLEIPGDHRVAEVREVIAHRNRTENMRVAYYSIIGRDITLRRRAEDEAKKQQLEMAHMSRLMSVGELATGLAHEINQPLGAIINYARGSLRRLENDNPAEQQLTMASQSLEMINRQAHRASQIVKRLRSFVRRTDFQRIDFSINESCCEVTKLLAHEARNSQIQFDLQLDPSEPQITADKVQIEQVILNLVRNAIEAYGDCENATRPVIINTRCEGRWLIIGVIDHAGGIAPEHLEQLFEPFFTVKESGLGMGLAISQTIIETHRGMLWVESQGQSSQFYVKLPLEEH